MQNWKLFPIYFCAIVLFTRCSAKEHAIDEPGLYVSKESIKPHPRFVPEKDLPMFDPRLAFFDTAKFHLKKQARDAMVPTADFMKKNSKIKLVVEGYCDERGSDEYNQTLGEKRAGAAKAFLVACGVPEDRIRTISYGKILGREASLMAKNRRVGFQLIYPTRSE